MKIIYLFAILLCITAYSCKDSDVLSPSDPGTSASYYLVDSTPHSGVIDIVLKDQNNFYWTALKNSYRAFKYNSGVKTEVSLGNFQARAVDALTTSYYAYAGYSNTGQVSIKLFANEVLTTIPLDNVFHDVFKIKIFEEGKIMLAADTVIYIYNSGSVKKYKLNPRAITYAIAGTFSKIQFAAFSNTLNADYIYVIENDSLKQADVEGTSVRLKAAAGSNLIMQSFAPNSAVTISYLNAGNTRSQLFSFNSEQRVFLAAENLNKVFAVSRPALVWNGSTVVQDAAVLPQPNSTYTTYGVSNSVNGVFLAAGQDLSADTVSYIYMRR